MNATKWTIYCHTHIATGRRYIGLTKRSMEVRWRSHMRDAIARRGRGCRHFWNAIRTYGEAAFSHEVLETCHSLEVANVAEECWIELYGTRNPDKGFNLIKGGGHIPHIFTNPWDRPDYRERMIVASKAGLNTPESKARRSEASRKLWADPDFREKNRQAVSAAQADPALKERLAAANRGKVLSPETRARISASSRCQDPEVKARISDATKQAMGRPEVREKFLTNLRKAMSSPETRAKISAAQKGRPANPDQIVKVKATWAAKPLPSHCRKGHSMEDAIITFDGKKGRDRRRCRACRDAPAS